MPDRVKFLAAKKRLRRRLRRIIATHEQLAIDIGWWNQNRTEAEPFDNGGDLVVVKLAREILDMVEAEKNIPLAMMQRLQQQIEANANA